MSRSSTHQRTTAFLLSFVIAVALIAIAPSEGLAQSIKVLSPNGGETWEAGTTQTVKWQANGIDDELEVEFTSDGSQWRRIARVSGSTTQVSWLVDNRPSEIAQVRVSARRGGASDVSDAVFTITPDPLDQILVLSPNGGEVLTEGEVYPIRFQMPVDATDAFLEYSTNFGVNWQPINTIAASLGQYPWTVPNIGASAISTALIRVSIPDAVDEFDVSNAAFTIKPKTIVTPAKLSITYPNGGETLEGGKTVNVTWSYTPASNETGEGEGPQVLVQYSTNGGSSWQEIATEAATGGSHAWAIPNVSTTTALVRAMQVGGLLGDTSNTTFTINATVIGTEGLAVTSPNGGEVWKEGESHTITWTADREGDAKILLETTDQQNNTKREQLAVIAANAQSIPWIVPAIGSDPVLARIIVEVSGLEDASDAPFTILPQSALSVRINSSDRFMLRGFYPNPAQDIVTFSWTPTGKSAVVGKLFNSSGAVVRTTSVSGYSSELSISVRDLPQGAYFYELISEGHISRGTLTIAR